jgi:hypothetical protein
MDRRGTAVAGVLIAAASLVLATGVAAGATLFQATLDESQNVPPTGSGATGFATLILNDAQTEVEYAITYQDLEGVEQASHFHKAPPGENGSPIHFLPVGTPKLGTWDLTTHDVADLFAGLIYINVHTTLHPGGEIRGNFSESATGLSAETAQTSWGKIKSLFR